VQAQPLRYRRQRSSFIYSPNTAAPTTCPSKLSGAFPATLAACDPTGTINLAGELGVIKTIAAGGIAASRQGSDDTTWTLWSEFCIDLACDPFLQDIAEPLPLLQIFAH
jgi:hypothetical protein